MTKVKTDRSLMVGAARINGQECLVNTGTLDSFVAGILRYGQVDRDEAQSLEVTSRQQLESVYGIDDSRAGTDPKPFVYKDGVAVIPVHGSLINRFNSTWSFLTGYNFIRRQMNLALEDEDVEVIVFDIDSSGGEAAGNFELCREIMAARDSKPCIAVIDSKSMSGGYSIAASCSRIYAIPSANVGSIGVYRMHIDVSESLKADGVKITFAKAGAHKVDGNPYEPLPDSVLKDWEECAGKTWEDFISVVAEGRGISPAQVRDTQAKIYRADEALDLGLIDAIKTPSEAIAAFIAELAGDEPSEEENEDMAGNQTQQKPEHVSGQPQPQVSADAIAAAIAAHETQKRDRRLAIRALPEAEGRAALVQTLIEDTDNTVEQCKVILASAAKELPNQVSRADGGNGGDSGDDSDDGEGDEGDGEDGDADDGDADDGAQQARSNRRGDRVNHFQQAMGSTPNPEIGRGREKNGGNGEKSDADLTAGILAAQGMATGRSVPGNSKAA